MRHQQQEGFILPTVLIFLTALSIMGATAVFITWVDVQMSRSFAVASRTHYLAEAGLAASLFPDRGPEPSHPPVVGGGGTAMITYEQLLTLGTGESLYRAESEGRITVGGTDFRRTVGRVMWFADPPRVPGALTAFGEVQGIPTGTISGVDAEGANCPEQASPVAAIAFVGSEPDTSSITVQGSPLLVDISGGKPADITGVWWSELFESWAYAPDAIFPADPWPSQGDDNRPHIVIEEKATLGRTHSGNGAIVARDDLIVGDAFEWNGLILVGQTLRIQGPVTITGAIVAGLDGSATAVDFTGGSIDLRFKACEVTSAGTRVQTLPAPVPGSWYEVW